MTMIENRDLVRRSSATKHAVVGFVRSVREVISNAALGLASGSLIVAAVAAFYLA